MLILTRKPGESIYIGDNIKIVVVEVKGSQVRLGIDAEKSLRILREEIYLEILEQNRRAAEAAQAPESGLDTISESWKGRSQRSGEGINPLVAKTPERLVPRDLKERPPAEGAPASGPRKADPPVEHKLRKKKSDE